MQLTVPMLRHTYAMLRESAPMRRWGLPKSEGVEFKITRSALEYGSYRSNPHEISISRCMVKSVGLLVETMAHEMIHVRQQIAGAKRVADGTLGHGDDFRRMALQTCERLGLAKI